MANELGINVGKNNVNAEVGLSQIIKRQKYNSY